MHGTAILVGKATPASITGVLDELAAAARLLTGDAVEIDVVLVSRDPAVVDRAQAVSDAHDLELAVLHSPDGGAWAMQQLAFEHALKHSDPDFVVTLDAAGHHDARQLPELWRAFHLSGSGVTIGSRWARGGSAPDTRIARRLLSRFASRLVAWATGLRRIHDITTSFRVIRADAA